MDIDKALAEIHCILMVEMDGFVTSDNIFKNDDQTSIVWQLVSIYLAMKATGTRRRLMALAKSKDNARDLISGWLFNMTHPERSVAATKVDANDFFERRYEDNIRKGSEYEYQWKLNAIGDAIKKIGTIAELALARHRLADDLIDGIWDELEPLLPIAA